MMATLVWLRLESRQSRNRKEDEIAISKLRRAAIYSVVGFTYEVLFSAAHDLARGKEVRFRTSPWMFPIYALVAPLYEPVHDVLRERMPRLARGAVYGAGFLAVEYTTGAALRAWRGEAPWDYTYARYHVNGLIRPDYFFLWAAAGLALEPLHDRLTARPTPTS
ncbi:MAG TPA: hypothetical protein VG106_05070 [Vicinamibacterales bacterium]|nr:hypothetical protein [Vicinamibacterales bacterium]